MPAAPSTAAPNPLREAMSSIVGTDPLSTSTGTADLISYEGGGGARLPASDVIAITGDPGTGATTAETWAHQLALENQQQQLKEFQWQQAQADIANAQRAAAEAREAGMYDFQRAAIQQQNALAQQTYDLNRAAEDRAELQFQYTVADPHAMQARATAAQNDYNRFMTGGTGMASVSQAGTDQYNRYLASGRPATGQYSQYVDPNLRIGVGRAQGHR